MAKMDFSKETRPYVHWDIIGEFMVKAFVKAGLTEEDAKICTDVLMESDRRGIESHGTNRFKPIYLDRINAGILNPVTEIEILKETPTTVVMDAHDGMGMVASHKMMKMLIEKRGRGEDVLDELLCFAGIATVCDVMSLQKENRIVVRKTLELLPKTRNIGLEALLALYWKEGERELSAFTLGFQLGPAINASGRLESAMESISLFLEKDREKAMLKAEHLKELNEERKSLTGNAVEEARKLAEAEGDKKLLLLYLPALHESLAGIVAGRIKEEFYRPTFVVTKSEEGKVKGSGRSIPAYPMAESLEKAKELLLRFGGHPMAAGFSLEEKNLPLLKEKLEKDCSLEPEDMVEKLWIDTVLPFSYCTEEFTESLRILEPFGKGNEKPSFAEKEVEIQGVRVLGEHRNVVKLNLSDTQGKRMEGIYFTDGEAFLSEKGDRKKMNIVYYPRINAYNGQKQVQAVISAHRFL